MLLVLVTGRAIVAIRLRNHQSPFWFGIFHERSQPAIRWNYHDFAEKNSEVQKSCSNRTNNNCDLIEKSTSKYRFFIVNPGKINPGRLFSLEKKGPGIVWFLFSRVVSFLGFLVLFIFLAICSFLELQATM